MEAISAIDKTTKNMPKQTTRNIQMPPAVPPFISDIAIILVKLVLNTSTARIL